jgi:hypothetical protein
MIKPEKSIIEIHNQNLIIKNGSKFNQSMNVLGSCKSNKNRRSNKKQHESLEKMSTALLYGTQTVQGVNN